MRAGYIDTSFLLSLIFRDENYEKSRNVWNELDLKFSSILLDIEASVNIYKYYIISKKDSSLYSHKETELNVILSNINKKIVDSEILLEIRNVDKLKRPRSLDSIHLATAHILNKLSTDRITICSYDKNMLDISSELGLAII
ncbi:MAG TPA: DNA-binding protein [Spirochaeta sp.]|nr:DNA-binding protein [Spirochaeta sp.]